MNTLQKKNSHFSFYKRTNSISNLIILSISILSTACATTHAKQDHAHAALAAQTKAIEALKRERAAPEIARKISADQTLSAAEARLRAVLEMLEQSNGAVQDAF